MAPKSLRSTNKKHLAHLAVVRRQEKIIAYTTAAIVILVVALVGTSIMSRSVLLPLRSVASVNGEKIKASDFVNQAQVTRLQLLNQLNQLYQFAQMFGVDPSTDPNFAPQVNQITGELNDPAMLGRSVLDQMIDDTLIRQEAEKLGITVSAEEIDAGLMETFGFGPEGTRTPTATATEPVYPTLDATQLAMVTATPLYTYTPEPPASETPAVVLTPDLTNSPTAAPSATATTAPTSTPVPPTATITPTSAPTETPTPYTMEGYQTQVADTITNVDEQIGFSEDEYRAIIERNLIYDKVFAAVTADVQPFEEQVWARHILVTDPNLAVAIIARLNAGQDFGALAAEYGTDATKDTGGDLGWTGRSGWVKEFADAAFSLKVGEFTETPVQSQFGYHVIQVLGHELRPVDSARFDDMKQSAFDEWLAGIRAAAEIEEYELWQEIVPLEPGLNSTSPQ